MERKKTWDFYIDNVNVLDIIPKDEDWLGVGIRDGEIEFNKLNSLGGVFFKDEESQELKDSDTITYGQFKQFMKCFIDVLKADLTSIAEM